MDKAVLLTKLNNCQDKSFSLYQFYINATTKSFESETDEFETCIENLKFLVDKQYDFEWLSVNAAAFGENRRDFKSLCEDVCTLLGYRIDDLCKHTRNPILTKPSKFEDYCPFSNEHLVIYGGNIQGNNIMIDGVSYRIIDTKLESTPYYNVYITVVE